MTLHSPGVVDVEGGRVTWSGPAADAPALPDGAHEVRHPGLVVPGFVNAHCHTAMVLLRGAGEGLPVPRWLREVMWPREARLVAADVATSMRLGAAEQLTAGVTTTVEMYFHGEQQAQAAIEAGLRCVVTAPVLEGTDHGLGDVADQLGAITDLAGRYADHELIEIGIGPHAAYSLSESTLEEVARIALERELLVSIHVAEAAGEDDEIMARTGLTSPAYLERVGMLEARVVAAHSIHLTGDDIALYAARGVGVAHCPGSNGKHASGIAPVRALRAAGVPVGIATDGPASSNRLDVLEEARMAMRYARIREQDAAALPHREALRMLTSEAADAIGRPDLGRLQPGSRADLVHVDLVRRGAGPTVEPDDVLTDLVWGGGPEAVRDVWVEGRQVVADGVVTGIDRDALAGELDAIAVRLAG
jgi:5-methylthioadenosine/S-adenosylhomocysteine deaminase